MIHKINAGQGKEPPHLCLLLLIYDLLTFLFVSFSGDRIFIPKGEPFRLNQVCFMALPLGLDLNLVDFPGRVRRLCQRAHWQRLTDWQSFNEFSNESFSQEFNSSKPPHFGISTRDNQTIWAIPFGIIEKHRGRRRRRKWTRRTKGNRNWKQTILLQIDTNHVRHE